MVAGKYLCLFGPNFQLVFCSYDPSTGTFTVPSGGEGLYYFSTYLLVAPGEAGQFNIIVNGDTLCIAFGDAFESASELPQAACSGLAQLAEGK